MESTPGNGGSGTSGMLHHLFKKHPLIHAEIMKANPSNKARKLDGERLRGFLRGACWKLDFEC